MNTFACCVNPTYTITVVPDISLGGVAHVVTTRDTGPTNIKPRRVHWRGFVFDLLRWAEVLNCPLEEEDSLYWITKRLTDGRAVSFLMKGDGLRDNTIIQGLMDMNRPTPSEFLAQMFARKKGDSRAIPASAP